MRTALKEWAVVVDALGTGAQILILRKGGIHDTAGGFQMDHPEFCLFPTAFHQQRESVIALAQERFDRSAISANGDSQIRIEYFARVADWRRLNSLATAECLRGQHIWRDEVIAQRFEWGREKTIHAVVLRVFRLPAPMLIPSLSKYAGCKSWLELDEEVPTSGTEPVLSDEAFEGKLRLFRRALDDDTSFCASGTSSLPQETVR
ncbi:MAG: DUF1802 family protein [Pedosphaera sp.]|nr:DUF1802 family protein [Pedosphaera sp.]